MISAISLFRLGALMEQLRADLVARQVFLCGLLQYRQFTLTVKTGETESRAPIPMHDYPFGDEMRKGFAEIVTEFIEECDKLDLRLPRTSAKYLLKLLGEEGVTIGQLQEPCVSLADRTIDTLADAVAVVVASRHEKYLANEPLFGPEVADVFPRCTADIEEAGACIAFERSTAAVFHLMRVMEVGMHGLAADLGVGEVGQNWHKLLQNMEAQIKLLPRSSEAEKQYLGKRSAAVAHLRTVKDAWRNDVMHPRETYTLQQAEDVWGHTKAFMVTLASFLSASEARPPTSEPR